MADAPYRSSDRKQSKKFIFFDYSIKLLKNITVALSGDDQTAPQRSIFSFFSRSYSFR